MRLFVPSNTNPIIIIVMSDHTYLYIFPFSYCAPGTLSPGYSYKIRGPLSPQKSTLAVPSICKSPIPGSNSLSLIFELGLRSLS